MEIWKLLIILSVMILLILVGNKVFYKDDAVVIEGTLKLNDSTDFVEHATTTTYIDFPQGFTKDNCYVSAIGTKVLQGKSGFGYGTTAEYDASDISQNLIPCKVLLGDQNGKIVLSAENIYADITLTYQIVLMKK